MSENTIDTIKIRKALEAAYSELSKRDETLPLAIACNAAIAALSAEQQEEAPTSFCIGVTYVTQQSDGRFLVVDAFAAPAAQPQESRQVRRRSKEDKEDKEKK